MVLSSVDSQTILTHSNSEMIVILGDIEDYSRKCFKFVIAVIFHMLVHDGYLAWNNPLRFNEFRDSHFDLL